jgi:hypothetical protein
LSQFQNQPERGSRFETGSLIYSRPFQNAPYGVSLGTALLDVTKKSGLDRFFQRLFQNQPELRLKPALAWQTRVF